MSFARVARLAAVMLALAGCNGGVAGIDASDAMPDVARTDGSADTTDVPTGPCGSAPTADIVQALPSRAVLRPGAHATLLLRLSIDACAPASFSVQSSRAGVVQAPDTVTVMPGASTIEFDVTALAAGETTLTAGDAMFHASVDVAVVDPTPIACPAGVSRAGVLALGMPIQGGAGTPLAAASIAYPPLASGLPATPMRIACAPMQIPPGYDAVGPAVSFLPAGVHFPRDVAFTLPVEASLIPPRDDLRVEITYTGPSVPAASIVPVASGHLVHSAAGDAFAFEAPRAGTYQAVIPHGLGTRTVLRHLTHRAIMGVSMGAAGASLIGSHHPERFDAIVPLGGPVEWGYELATIRAHALGGFCTAAERAMGATGCDATSLSRVPPPSDPFEHADHFEHLYEEGPGGSTFTRAEYVSIFRDLARMFGNPLLYAGPTGFLPFAVADSEATRTDAERCASPLTLHNFYDATYNPDGSLPVISFCDGNDDPMHLGVWESAIAPTMPVEVSFAVDIDGNGHRDGGEPVIVQSTEPYDDVGIDGLDDAHEPGFDVLANPDPDGDDYDWQYNPSGTEHNLRYDPPSGSVPGEPFRDVGLDGVMGTPQGDAGGYDHGEANGRFDTTQGFANFLAQNPLDHVNAMDDATLDRLAVWCDGGVRDLVDFGTDEDHFAGGFTHRPGGMHLSNGFATLAHDAVSETGYDATLPDWPHVPRHVMVRYGSLDASPDMIAMGDGTHVGSPGQIIQRITTGMRFIGEQWPDADRGPASPHLSGIPGDDCTLGYICTLQIHSDRANRTSETIVLLPPGYHEPAHAAQRYPVVVLLHGYGSTPETFQPLTFVLSPAMGVPSGASWQRIAKAIVVIPDGHCRAGDNCLLGTFFADGIAGSAQIETAILDTLDYVDAHFRTMPPADVPVTE